MAGKQCVAYVKHQAESEPDEVKRAASRHVRCSLVGWKRNKASIRKALCKRIRMLSRQLRSGSARGLFAEQAWAYASLRDVLDGTIAGVQPDEEQPSLWRGVREQR